MLEFLKKVRDKEDPAKGFARCASMCMRLASGRYDGLTGRYLTPEDDFDALLKEPPPSQPPAPGRPPRRQPNDCAYPDSVLHVIAERAGARSPARRRRLDVNRIKLSAPATRRLPSPLPTRS